MAKKQILIVDGDITHAEKLKQNLETEECIVEVFYHGNDAIKALERKWVDLIISSISLQGGMNGIQLLQEIKKHKDFKKIPVIIQTSKINMKEIIYQMGAELFVAKPYQTNDFIKEVKKILEK